MNMDDSYIELIDKFLRNELSISEERSFRAQMDDSTEFKKEVLLRAELLGYVEADRKLHLKSEFKQIYEKGKETEIESKVIPIYSRKWFQVAASVLLLFGVYFSFFNDQSNDQVFQDYYSPYPNVISSSRSAQQDVNPWLNYYNKGEYESVIKYFNRETEMNDTLTFYKGIAYLSINQSDSAIILLNEIPQTSIFKQQANWYKALALLKQEKTKEAQVQLREIKAGNFKYREANEVLEAIE